MVIEQVPLALVVDNAMMVGPAAVGMLGHNQAFVLVGTHWVFTHSITENLGILSDIRIGEIIVAVIFECEWTFGLTVW